MRQLFALLALGLSLVLFYPAANADMTLGYDTVLTAFNDGGGGWDKLVASTEDNSTSCSNCHSNGYSPGDLMAGITVPESAPDVWLFKTAGFTWDHGRLHRAIYIDRKQLYRLRC